MDTGFPAPIANAINLWRSRDQHKITANYRRKSWRRKQKKHFETFETGAAPVKAWVKGVPLDDGARRQLENVARLPFIHSHVAAMPDVHYGRGATIGSVIATKGAIIPAAVGVDIGCGMMAMRTSMTADQLPDNLASVRTVIEKTVPHGGVGVKGGWKDGVPTSIATRFTNSGLDDRLTAIEAKHPKIPRRQSRDPSGIAWRR